MYIVYSKAPLSIQALFINDDAIHKSNRTIRCLSSYNMVVDSGIVHINIDISYNVCFKNYLLANN